jgi:NADPH2:quinone reductase
VLVGQTAVGRSPAQLAKRRRDGPRHRRKPGSRALRGSASTGIAYRDVDFVEAVRSHREKGVELSSTRSGRHPAAQPALPAYRGARSPSATRAAATCASTRLRSPRESSLTGVFRAEALFQPARFAHARRVLADLAKGGLQVVIDRTYPLAEAAAAHATIESRAAFGRVVLIP